MHNFKIQILFLNFLMIFAFSNSFTMENSQFAAHMKFTDIQESLKKSTTFFNNRRDFWRNNTKGYDDELELARTIVSNNINRLQDDADSQKWLKNQYIAPVKKFCEQEFASMHKFNKDSSFKQRENIAGGVFCFVGFIGSIHYFAKFNSYWTYGLMPLCLFGTLQCAENLSSINKDLDKLPKYLGQLKEFKGKMEQTLDIQIDIEEKK